MTTTLRAIFASTLGVYTLALVTACSSPTGPIQDPNDPPDDPDEDDPTVDAVGQVAPAPDLEAAPFVLEFAGEPVLRKV